MPSSALEYATPSFNCVNCDSPVPWTRSIKVFCSEFCQQEADYVRYARRVKADGRILRHDIQEALEIRRAFILSGGYTASTRRLPAQRRKEVLARDQGLCRICGSKGSDVDHIYGPSNHLANLQLLCKDCHNKKTKSGFVAVTKTDPRHKQAMSKVNNLARRINSAQPTRPSDDERNWSVVYRQVRDERRIAFLRSLIPIYDGFANSGLGSKSMAIAFNNGGILTGTGRWYHQGILQIAKLKGALNTRPERSHNSM